MNSLNHMTTFEYNKNLDFAWLAKQLKVSETEAEARYEQWRTDNNRRLVDWLLSAPLAEWEFELLYGK